MRALLALPVALLLVCALPSPVLGQDPIPLTVGTPLRVTAERSVLELPPRGSRLARVTGSYVERTETTLLLDRRDDILTIPVAEISRLEFGVDNGRSVVGGVLGFVLGAGVGVVLWCMASRDSYGVPCGGDDDAGFFAGVGLGGGAGAWWLSGRMGGVRWYEIDVNRLSASGREPARRETMSR